MYAVIKTGGKQYRVMQGETLRVEKLEADVGAAVTFDQVLLLGEGEGITSLARALAPRSSSTAAPTRFASSNSAAASTT